MRSFQTAVDRWVGRRPLLKLMAAFGLVAASWGGQTAQAQTCNPFETTFQTTQAPDNFFSGNLYYSLDSNCDANPNRSEHCGGVINLPPMTTTQQKCALLQKDIHDGCGGIFGFQTDPLSTVDNQCNTLSLFKVRNTLCPSGSTGGVTFGVSNENTILSLLPTAGGYLTDYEFDVITPGCSTGMSNVNTVKGTSTGVSITGDGQSSVEGVIDLTSLGGPLVVRRIVTAAGDKPAVIIAHLRDALNVALVATGFPVSCRAVGSLTNRILTCGLTSNPGVVSAAAASGAGIGVLVGNDDTGLTRAVAAGPQAAIDRMISQVDNPTPSPSCPSFSGCNVSGPLAPPPPPGGSQVPATGTWALLATTGLLTALAVAALRRRELAA